MESIENLESTDITRGRTRAVEIVAVPERLHAGNVKEALRAVRASDGSVVVLDLRAVVAIDSTALGEVVRIHRRLLPTGGAVVLAGPSGGIRRVLAITRLDGLLSIVADIESATALADGAP